MINCTSHLKQFIAACFCLISLTTFIACGGSKNSTSSNNGKKPSNGKMDKTTGQNGGNNSSVDSIRWKVDPAVRPPISASTPRPSTNGNGGVVIDNGTTTYPNNGNGTVLQPGEVVNAATPFNLTLLLPFYGEKYVEGNPIPSKSQFAVDFYAGARLAIDSLSLQPFKTNINVLDSRNNPQGLFSRAEVVNSDLIIGPVEKDLIPQFLDFSQRYNKTVVSPFFPSGDVDGVHPNFIQVKPSLRTHCENILRHARSMFNAQQIVLVARSAENEIARFNYFQDANSAINQSQNGGGRLDEWDITDENNLDPTTYIRPTGTTVFIIPSWNENFVGSFLKKLNASPNRNRIVVYGMPQWLDFDKSLYPAYANLSARISSSTYINANDMAARDFKSKYVARFKKAPSTDSFLGFDCVMYFGTELYRYGNKFSAYLQNEQRPVLHTQFKFEPVLARTSADGDIGDNAAKYENKYVNILKFNVNGFKLEGQ